ncbi:hypothetical protein BCR43DRAFT_490465 [Syncephalastrum racemosum]|uniref:Uncharacterized protein n=1 Tax=Syncephalastrum racemosum TaxID=13706 RepID=A0A1X2HG24_SYNRA|nr:hypothetical protein BCR43DRAFT_490465 [Syncephalastrum racemosum]
MSDKNVNALGERFQELRSLQGQYNGGEFNETVDSPNGEKYQVMKSLGDQLGLPGTAAADILARLGKPDELTPSLQSSAGVPVMPGPAMTGGQVQQQQQQSYYLVYYWRQKHDYLYFKIDPVNETVITSDWHKTE